MKKAEYGIAAVWLICGLLTLAAFFAKDFVVYDFQMMPSNYAYTRGEERPAQASSSLWFALGPDRELQYGYETSVDPEDVILYGKTEEDVLTLTNADMSPILPGPTLDRIHRSWYPGSSISRSCPLSFPDAGGRGRQGIQPADCSAFHEPVLTLSKNAYTRFYGGPHLPVYRGLL